MRDINTILSFVCESWDEHILEKNILETTKLFIIDYYASMMAGYQVNRSFNEAIFSVLEEASGKEESSIIFCDKKYPVEQAAFMNAIYAHGADMDDGNKKSMGHIASHTMSAVFALAETLDVTWGEVCVAINVGYEVFNRIAMAAQPGLAHRGFHATGMAGGMACAAACAKLMKLDAAGIYSAISIAAVQSSGLFIITESGQECKPLNPANAAKVGIISAKLAHKGVRGPSNIFEHPKGWFHAVTDQVNDELILEGLGEVFTIQECYLKPYPSCRHTHAVIECAIQIRKKMIEKYEYAYVEKIEKINLYIYSNAMRVAGQIVRPTNNEDAKFSIHYSLAIALLKGQFALSDLNIKNAPTEVGDIIDKLNIIIDDSWENVKEGIRGAKIDLITNDDTIYTYSVKTPKGEGANSFTEEDIVNKLRCCAEKILTQTQQENLFLSIKNIDISEKYSPICIG